MRSKSRITTTSLNNFKPLRQTLYWNRNRPGIHFSHSSSLGRMKSSRLMKEQLYLSFPNPIMIFLMKDPFGKGSPLRSHAFCTFFLSHFPPFSSSIQAPVIKISIFMYFPDLNSCLGEALLYYSLLKDKNEHLGKGINTIYWNGKELKSPAVLGLHSSKFALFLALKIQTSAQVNLAAL